MDNRDILLTPIKIGEHTCQNRFFSQPMECNDADPEGNPTDLTYQRYENLFRGEAGMVCLEAITITDKNRGRMNQLFIMPKNQPALEKFIRRLREVNPKTLFVFQLTHAGELSNPEFSKRLSVRALPGFQADVFSEEGACASPRAPPPSCYRPGARASRRSPTRCTCAMLEGSVRRAGERVRITAQLIDVSTGYHLFSQQYDRGIADVLAIQNEIARELVQALLPKLGLDASTPLLARGTDNPEAHDLRLKARQMNGHVTARGLQLELSALLERAVALDPGYGAAWGDLSMAYLVDGLYGWSEPVPALNLATVAADRALALDPENAAALITRGVTAALIDVDHAAADAYFRRARESGIDEAFWAFFHLGKSLLVLGAQQRAQVDMPVTFILLPPVEVHVEGCVHGRFYDAAFDLDHALLRFTQAEIQIAHLNKFRLA